VTRGSTSMSGSNRGDDVASIFAGGLTTTC
jgi:hypothetical protein